MPLTAVRGGLESVDGLPDRELQQFVRRILRRLDGDGVDADSDGEEVFVVHAEEAEEHDELVSSEEERRRDAQDARAALAARVALVLEALVSRGVLQKCGLEGERWRLLSAREKRVLVLPERATNRTKKGEGGRNEAGGKQVSKKAERKHRKEVYKDCT